MKTKTDVILAIRKYGLDAPVDSDICLNFGEANGCGAKGGWPIFHTMYLLDIEVACYLHDIAWAVAETKEDVYRANKAFEQNLYKIIDANSNRLMNFLRRRRALKYYIAVKYMGTQSYLEERGMV